MTTVAYALSGYLAAPGCDGLIFNRHDHAIALWKIRDDAVELARYWQLERISGQKHHDWPILSEDDLAEFVESLLEAEGLRLDDIGWAWGIPCRADEGRLASLAASTTISSHALAHLFSALLLDSRLMKTGTVLAMAVDGGPDFVGQSRVPDHYYAGAVARHGTLQIAPIESAGQIYEAACQFYGMEPGTLMALAGMCRCAVAGSLDELIRDRRFDNRRGQMTIAPRTIAEIDARCGEAFAAGTATRCEDDRPTGREHFVSAVMKQVQALSTMIAARNVDWLVRQHGVDPNEAHLAIGGGFALNCPTNSWLLEHFGFRGIHIPPAADDSGQALGLGLAELYLHGFLDNRDFVLDTPYLGPTDVETELATVCGGAGAAPFDADRFVADVSNGPVAWIDGRSEIGPRALGHRSLLADPRRDDHRDALNRIKQRQWWRPVAPVVLQDRAGEWFDRGHRSPYMLETWDVLADKRSVVPAITHLDGSARVQTLTERDDPRLHAAISAFGDATGVPLLCNTSLNAKGEPIVETTADAIRFCVNHGVEVVYIAGRRLVLDPAPRSAEPLHRRSDVFVRQERVLRALWDDLDGQGVTPEMLFLVAGRPEFRPMLFDAGGRRKLAEMMAFVVRTDPENVDRAARYASSRGRDACFGLVPLQRYVARPGVTEGTA